MKLSEKQRDVLAGMRGGIPYYYNAVTTYHPYTLKSYGTMAPMVNGAIMNKIEKMGLVTKQRFNQGGIYKYELTKLGKTIEL